GHACPLLIVERYHASQTRQHLQEVRGNNGVCLVCNMDVESFVFLHQAVNGNEEVMRRGGGSGGSVLVIRTSLTTTARNNNFEAEVQPLIQLLRWYETTYGDRPGFEALKEDVEHAWLIRRSKWEPVTYSQKPWRQSGCMGM